MSPKLLYVAWRQWVRMKCTIKRNYFYPKAVFIPCYYTQKESILFYCLNHSKTQWAQRDWCALIPGILQIQNLEILMSGFGFFEINYLPTQGWGRTLRWSWEGKKSIQMEENMTFPLLVALWCILVSTKILGFVCLLLLLVIPRSSGPSERTRGLFTSWSGIPNVERPELPAVRHSSPAPLWV